METKDKIKHAIEILKVISEAIRDLKEIPSGELYARLMDHLSLQDYNKAISILKGSKVIVEINKN